jgi:RimJ/RimL family protein N-acetyltransferase
MIEGKLVNLRAMEMADLERCTRWINDREVTRFLAMRYHMPQAAEETWLRDLVSKPMSFERPFFAIETKDGVHIGNTNLFDASPEDHDASLGIMIGEKAYWGRGFGTDAMMTLLGFGFDEMNLHRVQLQVYAFNERAIACYRKCGFVEEVRQRQHIYTDGQYHDALIMGLLRPEFEAVRGAA